MTDRNSLDMRLPRRTRLGKTATLAGLALGALGLAGCEVAPPPGGSPGAAPGYGYTCYAGVYVCHTQTQLPVGSPCSCPGLGAPSYGRVQ
jgi:hypothetical protein